MRRLIVVSSYDRSLYEAIRKYHRGDERVTVILDRRRTERRRRSDPQAPDRRRAERRLRNVSPELVAQGWADVWLPDD